MPLKNMKNEWSYKIYIYLYFYNIILYVHSMPFILLILSQPYSNMKALNAS